MTAATVQRSVDPLLDAEALRVVRLQKEWAPTTWGAGGKNERSDSGQIPTAVIDFLVNLDS